MNANDFHVGQLVSATDPATMTVLCATYTHYSTHGIVKLFGNACGAVDVS
jgi:hypothetical protein